MIGTDYSHSDASANLTALGEVKRWEAAGKIDATVASAILETNPQNFYGREKQRKDRRKVAGSAGLFRTLSHVRGIALSSKPELTVIALCVLEGIGFH